LKERGIHKDLFTLEHGIAKTLEALNLSLDDLDLKGCTLVYRRRAIDMPLSPMQTDTPEKLQKAQMVRQKILDNFQRKYLFNFVPCLMPVEALSGNGRLQGIKFQQTKIEQGKAVPVEGSFKEIKTPLVISSIGSIPEMIDGVPADRGIFKISDPNSCQIDGFDHVFAIGNAVTGKGNIVESVKHSREISTEIGENFLEWQHNDYQNWHRETAKKVDEDLNEIIETLKNTRGISDEKLTSILGRVLKFQAKAGYNGKYSDWVKNYIPVRMEDAI
jgi:NADPH-dependent glutamate synthase beta subunit-like oxidoreductase